MIKWFFDWLRHKFGHYLLADEEAEASKREEERERRMKEIMDANYTVDDVTDDLDNGRF